MENYNLHRRAQSGWHPTTYSRKPTPDAPRERNYEAILEAAKRPPVGYWEDAPRGIQFGGGRNNVSVDVQKPDAAPALAEFEAAAEFEPPKTTPRVGDVAVNSATGTQRKVLELRQGASGKVEVILDDNGGRKVVGIQCFWDRPELYQYRILKRQPRKQVEGARAWKTTHPEALDGYAVVEVDGRLFVRNGRVSGPGWGAGAHGCYFNAREDIELPAHEAQALNAERIAAMGK